MLKGKIHIYIISFIVGFVAPIIAFKFVPAMKDSLSSHVKLSPESLSYKTKMEFLSSPSVALLDSIKAHELVCMCGTYNYNDYIYYWIMKDPNRYGAISTERHQSICRLLYKELKDSTIFFSPNADMLLFAEQVKDMLEAKPRVE